MNKETIAIIDFGGQYKQLIARRIRECSVYSEIFHCTVTADKLSKLNLKGIILTGEPRSVFDSNSPVCDKKIFELGVPILGICYGMQYICHIEGGVVSPCDKSEYGTINANILSDSDLFYNLNEKQEVLMSDTGKVQKLPEGFIATAHTETCEIAAFENTQKKLYGVQFHPEVETTVNGNEIINNFVFKICGASGDHSMADYLERQISEVREKVGAKKILLGLSGGIDSSVCAALLSEAIGDQLVCIFINHGFMRKNEPEEVCEIFSKRNLNFIYVDARKRFLDKLKGVTDPEKKRKIIGDEFVRTFEDEAKKCGNPDFLAQGTIYPDIVESGIGDGAVIKSHHNVGGLPDSMIFEGVIEPLASLFKDEVRRLGLLLKLPEKLVYRQPFPGPGLAIRVIGELTEKKLDILRDADLILREEIAASNFKADQYFAVLTNTQSVGVTGELRTYDYTLALRAVITNDFMTCEFAHIPYPLLTKISSRITNEVKGINRVVYDITSKPPATIEWE